MNNCKFCLDNRTLEGEILAETNSAFMIEASSSSGNYLLIPKAHIEGLAGLPDGWWREVKELLAKVPDLTTDYNVSVNYGKAAGQLMPHLHFWVVSRQPDQPASGKGLALLVREANANG